MENANLVIKKYIPSLALFIVGFIVSSKYIWNDLSMGFIGGWLLGGIVWGWYLTSNWFGPSNFETFSVFWIFGFIFRFMVSAAVGIVAMPLGIIQLIIAIFVKGKQVSDAVNAYKAEHTNQSQPTVYNTPGTPPINSVINTGETWVCKKCNEENPNTSLSCKGCGAYK